MKCLVEDLEIIQLSNYLLGDASYSYSLYLK